MRNWSKSLNNSSLTDRSPYHFDRFAIARSVVELKSVALQSRKNGRRSSAPVAVSNRLARHLSSRRQRERLLCLRLLPAASFVKRCTRRPKRVCSGAIITQRLDHHARRSPLLIGASVIAGDQPNFCFLLASRFHAKVAPKDRLRL
jgi:hypothetical protein